MMNCLRCARSPALFFALLFVVPVTPRPAWPARPTASADTDLASYVAELDRISAAVRDLAADPAGIAPLRDSLPKSWSVHAGDERYDVATVWLDSALETMQTTPAVRASLQKDIQSRLQVLKDHAQALLTPAAASATGAQARLESILSRREFRGVHQPTWWDRARARLWSWLAGLFRKLFRRFPAGRRAGDVLVWCVIVLAFLLLALWFGRAVLRASSSAALDLKGLPPTGKTWRDWAQQALHAAARHDYREAVHAAYWAGVHRLEELGVWQMDRARTPREYMRLLAAGAAAGSPSAGQLSPSPEQAARVAALAALTRSLETTWYGFYPATAGDFHSAVVQLEALGCRFPSNLATAGS